MRYTRRNLLPVKANNEPVVLDNLTKARAMFQVLEMTRAELAARLGKSYYNNGVAGRDVYTALGYKKILEFKDFMLRFIRQDIAKRIVKAAPDASWRLAPSIVEKTESKNKKNENTIFEKAWNDLESKNKIIHYLSRVDTVSGIGRYGVLLMGFDDGGELSEPVTKAKNLLYLQVYAEDNAQITEWEKDTKSERYGLPKIYSLKRTDISAGVESTKTEKVHYSRVLHVAEDCLENDIYGTSRLEACFNRLSDLELICGGSAEMFWRGAFPGLNFKLDPDADTETMDMDDLKSQIANYTHQLQRFLRTQGVEVQEISPQVVSPKEHIESQILFISAVTGIPQRILFGSERGNLASEQDSANWDTKIDERRNNYCELMILRALIDVLIKYGVLPSPKDGYLVVWPPLFTPNEKERAEAGKLKTDSVVSYANSMGAENVVAPRVFLRGFMNFSDEEIDENEKLISANMLEIGNDNQDDLFDKNQNLNDDEEDENNNQNRRE